MEPDRVRAQVVFPQLTEVKGTRPMEVIPVTFHARFDRTASLVVAGPAVLALPMVVRLVCNHRGPVARVVGWTTPVEQRAAEVDAIPRGEATGFGVGLGAVAVQEPCIERPVVMVVGGTRQRDVIVPGVPLGAVVVA